MAATKAARSATGPRMLDWRGAGRPALTVQANCDQPRNTAVLFAQKLQRGHRIQKNPRAARVEIELLRQLLSRHGLASQDVEQLKLCRRTHNAGRHVAGRHLHHLLPVGPGFRHDRALLVPEFS
jgi:hypothetical protein